MSMRAVVEPAALNGLREFREAAFYVRSGQVVEAKSLEARRIDDVSGMVGQMIQAYACGWSVVRRLSSVLRVVAERSVCP